jgi:membrane protein DedA with SNARE-associated domain
VPALKRFFAWNRPGGLIWTLPLTILAGLAASRAVHSKPGKALVRSAVHAGLWALILRPVLGLARGHR